LTESKNKQETFNLLKLLTVFNIQRFSLHDGAGVRTNIFFKGCPLSCLWCNNPESIDPFPSVMFDERQCHMFGDCIRAGKGHIVAEKNMLKIEREKITDFESLRNICPSKALIVAGETKSVSQIINEIEKDIPFYEMSGGGVTLSGGEAFSQGNDLMELVVELKKMGIHVSIETSLHVPWETIENYLSLIDVFLARYTGGNAALVLNNFRELDKTEKDFIVRIPVIPNFNYSESELCTIIDFAAGLKNALEINFIPFHSLAREKYAMLGKEYIFENHRNIEKAELVPYVEYAERKGMTAKIIK
jgi:pyruvate formate lyase activating enzyme